MIGGAGGKLNYLKLRGVKSEEEYKERVHANAQGRKEAAARQRQRDQRKPGATPCHQQYPKSLNNNRK